MRKGYVSPRIKKFTTIRYVFFFFPFCPSPVLFDIIYNSPPVARYPFERCKSCFWKQRRFSRTSTATKSPVLCAMHNAKTYCFLFFFYFLAVCSRDMFCVVLVMYAYEIQRCTTMRVARKLFFQSPSSFSGTASHRHTVFRFRRLRGGGLQIWHVFVILILKTVQEKLKNRNIKMKGNIRTPKTSSWAHQWNANKFHNRASPS